MCIRLDGVDHTLCPFTSLSSTPGRMVEEHQQNSEKRQSFRQTMPVGKIMREGISQPKIFLRVTGRPQSCNACVRTGSVGVHTKRTFML